MKVYLLVAFQRLVTVHGLIHRLNRYNQTESQTKQVQSG